MHQQTTVGRKRRSKKQVRAHACERKSRYDTESFAKYMLRYIQREKKVKDAYRMTAYKCGFCQGYHLGHVPASKRSAS